MGAYIIAEAGVNHNGRPRSYASPQKTPGRTA